MGSAMGLYVADNHNMLPPACYTDELSYEYLATCPVTDQYGNTWYPTYQSGYVYRNLIGIYLGLGDCMPGRRYNYSTQYPRWEAAMYSHFSQFICPSGVNMTSPYGYAVQAPVGQGEGSCFYAQNVSWTSQSSRIGGPSWPVQSAYYPLFTDTGAAIVLYEQWSGNGGSMGCDDDMGQPYSTHYRYGYKGAQGIGRNILYADWHCTFLPTGPPDDVPFMLWGQYPYLRRGNDMGNVFQDQWQGRTWTAWDLFQDLKTAG